MAKNQDRCNAISKPKYNREIKQYERQNVKNNIGIGKSNQKDKVDNKSPTIRTQEGILYEKKDSRTKTYSNVHWVGVGHPSSKTTSSRSVSVCDLSDDPSSSPINKLTLSTSHKTHTFKRKSEKKILGERNNDNNSKRTKIISNSSNNQSKKTQTSTGPHADVNDFKFKPIKPYETTACKDAISPKSNESLTSGDSWKFGPLKGMPKTRINTESPVHSPVSRRLMSSPARCLPGQMRSYSPWGIYRSNTPTGKSRTNSPFVKTQRNSQAAKSRTNSPIRKSRTNSPMGKSRTNSPMGKSRTNSPMGKSRANLSVRSKSPFKVNMRSGVSSPKIETCRCCTPYWERNPEDVDLEVMMENVFKMSEHYRSSDLVLDPKILAEATKGVSNLLIGEVLPNPIAISRIKSFRSMITGDSIYNGPLNNRFSEDGKFY